MFFSFFFSFFFLFFSFLLSIKSNLSVSFNSVFLSFFLSCLLLSFHLYFCLSFFLSLSLSFFFLSFFLSVLLSDAGSSALMEQNELSCRDGFDLNYSLPMFQLCKTTEHTNGLMIPTIPKIIPPSRYEDATSRRQSWLGIPPGRRVCRIPGKKEIIMLLIKIYVCFIYRATANKFVRCRSKLLNQKFVTVRILQYSRKKVSRL